MMDLSYGKTSQLISTVQLGVMIVAMVT